MADFEFAGDHGRVTRAPVVTTSGLVNLTGAALSVALVAGVAVWGYKLMVRDVHGIPVVAAAEGPMRVQPDDPGGRQAAHQGLAVNHVKANNGAAPPADTLQLAPRPVDVLETDQAGLAAAIEDTMQTMAEADDASLAALEATATPVAMTAARMPDVSAEEARSLIDAALQEAQENAPAAASEGPGLARSVRPAARPERSVQVASADPAAAVVPASIDVPADQVPSGTRLVQLGAFDSPETAKSEWTRISGRFEGYLDGKQRVIQRAESGGRTFYRLRAMGFADLSDARRFCSALVAENAACIPVVVR